MAVNGTTVNDRALLSSSDASFTSSAELDLEPLSDQHTTSAKVDKKTEHQTLLEKGSEEFDRDPDLRTEELVSNEEAALPVSEEVSAKKLKRPVPWSALPRKDQLLVLTLARLSDPLFQSGIASYMFFMLQSFDASLTDAQIATQAGILTGGFTLAQCVTAVWWGRLADKPWVGRKNIVLVGLVGSFFTSIGFAFSKSLWSALFFRTVGGALNGNVGVLRTMISELVKEKKYQPKAFLILPATFNFGVLVGPLLGGWLQNPVETFPATFGPGSKLGGANGVQWMIDYPYALPNLLNAVLFLFSLALAVLGLEETLIDRAHYVDPGRRAGRWIQKKVQAWFNRQESFEYTALNNQPHDTVELALQSMQRPAIVTPSLPKGAPPKLPFRRIFTRNVIFTMLTHGLLHIHASAFTVLWFLFLSTPRFDPAAPQPPNHTSQHLPFAFTGGLGLPPPTIGLAIGVIGFLGLILQFGIYSRVTFHLGVVMTYRLAMLLMFPIAYTLAPYLAMIPTKSSSPLPADGSLIWIAIFFVLFFQVVGRTFVLPIGQILVNNCSPHPSVLGTIHGIGQSVSSGGRTVGPLIWSILYGIGLEKGFVGMAWWILTGGALLAAGASWFLREGDGHEIVLDGD